MATFPNSSSMSPTSYPYQIGGSLSVDAPCYVERPADTMLYEALLAGEFCYVLNARQMGKSSLLVRTKQRLEEKGIRCVALDLTGIGGLNTTPEQWYKGLFVQICLGLKLLKKIKFKVWWQDHADLPLAQRIILFIRDILLTYIPDQPIVIFIDEIDTVLGLPFPGDDFFDLIRFCFNQRSVDSQFTRITFALFGVANPATLIQDPRRTPFNIGRAIPLTGFSLSQTDPLMGGLPLPHDIAFESLSAILTWTGGQPFLTHKLCQIVGNHFAANPCQPISDVVAKLVQSNIIENWQTQDNPEHLSTIANRILSNPQTAGRLLGIYQRILASNVVKFDHSPEHIELLLSGIVINQDETLQIKNRIYESVFTPQWVQQKLEQIRPYAQQFNAWVSSHQQRTDHLLRGPVLKEALAWAQDKQLSDVDYRFLGASQTLASQLAKQALAEEKQERELAELMVRSLQTATQIFSEARQTAKRQSRKAKLGQGWLGGIAAGVTGGVLLLRLAGLLQGMEWAAFDQLVKHRPVQGIDPRITMITVDEPDIRAAGSFPLSGQVLADLLERLNRYEPRVIGFDIYRDVPVEPGHDAFVQALARSPNVIGIEQVIEPSIEALPVLAAQNQVGFGDQIVDGDGIIRRALMSISAKDETSLHLSFSLQLALKYLTTENITPESLDDGSTQLGQAALKPFEPNTSGFYVGAEDGGYQMLLNYHGPITDFQHLSLTQVLAGEIDPDIVHDRIILIGFTAESVNDLFPSPYSKRLIGSAKPMAGITLHANMVSQLLGAALEGRPLLRVWPQPLEWFWIAGWAGLGAVLTWRIRALGGQIIGVAIAAGGLIGIAIFAFSQGWWIPLVPAFITLLGSAVILPVVTAKQIETLQLRQTAAILTQVAEEDPAVGQIAIAYLKQVEGQEPRRLALIQKYLAQAEVEMGNEPERSTIKDDISHPRCQPWPDPILYDDHTPLP